MTVSTLQYLLDEPTGRALGTTCAGSRLCPGVFLNPTHNAKCKSMYRVRRQEGVSSLTLWNMSIPEKGGSTPLNLTFMGMSIVQLMMV